MKFNLKFNLMIILLITLFLISFSAVSASDSNLDSNANISSDSNFNTDLSSNLNTDLDFNSVDYVDEDLGSNSNLDSNKSSNKENIKINLKSSIIVNGSTFEDIQSAIDNANENDEIILDGSFSSTGNFILVNKTLTITGLDFTYLNGNNASRIFRVVADGVVLKNLNIFNANPKDINGSGLYQGAVNWRANNGTVINCNFYNNFGAEKSYASAIYWYGDYGLIVNSTFYNNNVSANGGAIFALGNNFTVLNSEFRNNSGGEGGAIYLGGSSPMYIINCTFNSNYANLGGAIAACAANRNFINCIFINNTANDGGAISCCGSKSLISNSKFINNSAINKGGAIYFREGNNIVESSLFINNSAYDGGAIQSYNKNNVINYSIFENNNASHGLVYYGSGSDLEYNFYGININNEEKFIEDSLIYNGNTYKSPSNWVNINNEDILLNFLGQTIIYNLKFISNSNEDLNSSLPDYQVKLSNVNEENQILEKNILFYNNSATFILFTNTLDDDLIYVNNSDSKEITSIYVRENDTQEKENVILVVIPGEIFYGETEDLIVIIFASDYSQINGTGVLYYDDIEENITFVDGRFDKYISNLDVGSHNITVKYDGDEKYQEKTETSVVKVNRASTVIEYEDLTTYAIDTTVDGRKGDYFNVTLKDQRGNILVNKSVQIGFNGKVYNKTTDDNGVARLQINLKNKGTYTFAICFLSDDSYYASFVVAKISVKVQNPILTTSNFKYKASVKTKALTASFKSLRGNALVGKTISFLVNGKTYSAKTNSKGIATVKVSLSKKKTYNFTLKYAGDSTYSSISKSGKLVIS